MHISSKVNFCLPMLLYTLLLYLSISMNKNVEMELKTAKLTIYMKILTEIWRI